MGSLTDHVALVTGGGRGLGLAFARRLATGGARVVIAGRNTEILATAEKSLRTEGADVLAISADVTSDEDLDRLFDKLHAWGGRLDIVVNNAGIADEAAFHNITRESWERVIATNLTAPFLVMQRAARLMSPGGSIVNISSIDAYAADGPFASYVAAKAGLVALTKAGAVELAPLGIRVNSVSPGWALTDMAVEATTPAMLQHMQGDFARVPLRRLITPEEIANAVVFLAGSEATGITGVDLLVDGGTLANLYILETLPPEETP
jgi:NAD(P)-dependent dehydrogenase (short-subunit alcohol dehydrogenase family)